MKKYKKYLKFTQDDLHKTFKMYWCGHMNEIIPLYFDGDDVKVYNKDLDDSTWIHNYFTKNDKVELK